MSQARGCSLLFKTTMNRQRKMEARFPRKDDQGEGVTLHGAPDQKVVALETSLVAQWLQISGGETGSIPAWGTKISHALELLSQELWRPRATTREPVSQLRPDAAK